MNDKVYVSIVNYNNYNKTVNCLNSILNLKYDNLNIILIDNKSVDDSYSKLKLWLESKNLSFSNNICDFNLITLLKTKYNGGYAYANNIAIKLVCRLCDNPYIWILNNDTIVDKDSLKFLINSFRNNDVQISGSKILHSDTSIVESFGGKITNFFFSAYNNKKILNESIDYIPGTSIFFKKNVIDKIGYFSEQYFMYYEDVDWSTKALKKNIKLKLVNDSIVRHYKANNTSLYLRFYSFKNRLLYIYNNYPFYFPFQLLLLPIYIIKKIFFK